VDNYQLLHLDTIYHYNPDDDSWTLLDAKLKNGAYSVAAMAVPRKMFHTK
jgi:N-acetylneuraminic acid mutarotase